LTFRTDGNRSAARRGETRSIHDFIGVKHTPKTIPELATVPYSTRFAASRSAARSLLHEVTEIATLRDAAKQAVHNVIRGESEIPNSPGR
jgi:hypothetical protein